MKKDVFLLDTESLKNLVYLYYMLHPNMTGRRIFTIWYRSNVFGEYTRPESDTLVSWIEEFKIELTQVIVERGANTNAKN